MPAFTKDPRFWGGVAVGFFVAPGLIKVATMQLARLRDKASTGGK